MKKLVLIVLLNSCGLFALAQRVDTIKKHVDGTVVLSTNDISTNISQIKELGRFKELVNAAGLDSVLHAVGPITVFAPTQYAFSHSGIDVADSLTKPANKAILTRLILNHVIKGNISIAEIRKQIEENSGNTTLTTLAGGKITATINVDRNMVLTDETNKASIISRFDLPASNGRIQILNGILLPGN
jgi:uncharacterized surface protein with fasciclin (FAS1) repeats